ncbi:MAG TPA: hypothetical protein VF486_08305 [Actinomycetes bacterium]
MDVTITRAPSRTTTASLFMVGVRRPLRGSLATSVLATVRPLSSAEVKRLGLVRRTEVLRNG